MAFGRGSKGGRRNMFDFGCAAALSLPTVPPATGADSQASPNSAIVTAIRSLRAIDCAVNIATPKDFAYCLSMTKLEKIEREIGALPPQDVRALGEWLDELREKLWDDEMARDAISGKLDKLAAEAMADIAAGRVKPL